MLFQMRNENEAVKLITAAFSERRHITRDLKVHRKGLEKLSANSERRERKTDRAKHEQGAN